MRGLHCILGLKLKVIFFTLKCYGFKKFKVASLDEKASTEIPIKGTVHIEVL